VHPRHHGGDAVGVDLAGGDVVEHEERLGTHTDQIIHAHGDQVDPHRLVAAGGPGHQELGTDAVGGGHQHRLGEAGEVERELPPEAADARYQPGQARHGGVAGPNVHSGPRVGGPALAHGRQTPGSAPWWAMATRGRVTLTGVDVGTAVG